MPRRATPLGRASAFLGAYRWVFLPAGLFALVAVGVHAAADSVDDRLRWLVQALDAWADGLWAGSDFTAAWVDAFGSRQQTLVARGLTLCWELAVDLLVALPALGYDEVQRDEGRRRLAFLREETWRGLFERVARRPTPARVLRPFLTAAFVLGGAVAVSRLLEASLFVGLQGGLAGAQLAGTLARAAGGVALALVLFSHGWRAVLRALQHADAACLAVERRGRRALLVGLWGNALGLPLALALLAEARTFWAVFL